MGGIFLILSTIINGLFVRANDDKPPPSIVLTNCDQQQKGVIEFVRANPGVIPKYSGPSDEQCHLNDIVVQEMKR